MPPKKKKQSSREYDIQTLPPTLTGCSDSPLKLSVINSSTENLLISELLIELWLLRVFAIDFYHRGVDIENALDINREVLERTSIAERYADPNIIRQLAQYIRNEKKEASRTIKKYFGESVSPKVFHVPALATFFPEISSFSDEHAEQAGKALAGAVKLAINLEVGVVEFVLGRVVERCHNSPLGYDTNSVLRCDFVHKADAEDRIKRAIAVLEEFVYPVAKGHVTLAAEIEPGFSFVLNNRDSIEIFLSKLHDKGLTDTIGLNLDIGHAIILANSENKDDQITTTDAKRWKHHIFHAHASDNIGFHFRDLVPGTYHYLTERKDDLTFSKWIEVCVECSEENDRFSKYIAVELESSSRIQWIQRSLLRLAYTIRDVCQ